MTTWPAGWLPIRSPPRSNARVVCMLLGTIQFAAPENLDNESPHFGQPPGDVYSWSMVAVEVVTGALPWAGKNIGQVITKIYYLTAIKDEISYFKACLHRRASNYAFIRIRYFFYYYSLELRICVIRPFRH